MVACQRLPLQIGIAAHGRRQSQFGQAAGDEKSPLGGLGTPHCRPCPNDMGVPNEAAVTAYGVNTLAYTTADFVVDPALRRGEYTYSLSDQVAPQDGQPWAGAENGGRERDGVQLTSGASRGLVR